MGTTQDHRSQLGLSNMVPKEGEHTKWITQWVLLPGADQFQPIAPD